MLSLDEIHERIEAVNERMEGLVSEITAAAGDAAVTESTFKVRFAQERLRVRDQASQNGTKITVDECEDRATVATQKERQGFLFGSNNLMVLREALRACQSQSDGLRTMAASTRAAGG